MYEFLNGISEALQYALQWISTQDYEKILTIIKDFSLTALGGGGIWAVFKWIIPLLRNSNKPVLTELANAVALIDGLKTELDKLKQEEANIKQATLTMLAYLETSANVNLTSKTLSPEQKTEYQKWIDLVKSLNITEATQGATLVEQKIADGVLTAEEVIEVAQTIKKVDELVLTPITKIGV